MGYQTCPTCHGQRFTQAPIISFRFLFGLMRLDPSLRNTCDQCQGQGRLPLSEHSNQDGIDLDQPEGYQTTGAFAQFVAEPQSPALREPRRSRETATS